MQTLKENILRVHILEPRQKHPAIFAGFDALGEGNSLIILNDHDPKPLYYQMLAERGNVFTFEYLEKGPQTWKVKITKRIEVENDETIGQIAAGDIRKALVFKKYGLDFCCGGKKTLNEACAEKGLDASIIKKELQRIEKSPESLQVPYEEWRPDFLAEYILNTHHSYVRKYLPEILECAKKVLKVHGDRHTELKAIYEKVCEVNDELMAHMFKEERILFPYINELIEAGKNSQPYAKHFGTIQSPINMMEMEHESVGTTLAEISELTNNYSLPDDACASYDHLYRMLIEFEDDLHIHIHLENNILFPSSLRIEKELNPCIEVQ